MVFAYDLAEHKEIWKFNLLGKSMSFTTSGGALAIDVEPVTGAVVLPTAEDEKQKRVGQIGIVESAYVCLLTREGLVAVDPNRPGPSVLWTKSDIAYRTQVFGDDRFVYLVEWPDANSNRKPTTRAVRAHDGVSTPVTDFGALYQKRLGIVGRCLLLFEDSTAGGKMIRLYDVQ